MHIPSALAPPLRHALKQPVLIITTNTDSINPGIRPNAFRLRHPVGNSDVLVSTRRHLAVQRGDWGGGGYVLFGERLALHVAMHGNNMKIDCDDGCMYVMIMMMMKGIGAATCYFENLLGFIRKRRPRFSLI